MKIEKKVIIFNSCKDKNFFIVEKMNLYIHIKFVYMQIFIFILQLISIKDSNFNYWNNDLKDL